MLVQGGAENAGPLYTVSQKILQRTPAGNVKCSADWFSKLVRRQIRHWTKWPLKAPPHCKDIAAHHLVKYYLRLLWLTLASCSDVLCKPVYICPLELFSCSDGAARQTRLVFQRAGDADELSAGGQISCGSSCGTWSRAAWELALRCGRAISSHRHTAVLGARWVSAHAQTRGPVYSLYWRNPLRSAYVVFRRRIVPRFQHREAYATTYVTNKVSP